MHPCTLHTGKMKRIWIRFWRLFSLSSRECHRFNIILLFLFSDEGIVTKSEFKFNSFSCVCEWVSLCLCRFMCLYDIWLFFSFFRIEFNLLLTSVYEAQSQLWNLVHSINVIQICNAVSCVFLFCCLVGALGRLVERTNKVDEERGTYMCESLVNLNWVHVSKCRCGNLNLSTIDIDT